MPRRLIFRAHAVVRMVERDISVEDVRGVLDRGEAIEIGRPLHVVAADDPEGVPALVCPNCGEGYVSEETARRISAAAAEVADKGIKVEVRQYAA